MYSNILLSKIYLKGKEKKKSFFFSYSLSFISNMHPNIKEALDSEPNMTILDVGCGSCTWIFVSLQNDLIFFTQTKT